MQSYSNNISSYGTGSNQLHVRDHNQRLVLSLIRQAGSLSKAQIARMSGLSAQTATVIMRELEQEKLLVRQAPVRGKVGQPSIPMALNPEGAFSIGLKVGRRSADLVLVDFVGNVLKQFHAAYSFPETTKIVDFVSDGVEKLLDILPQKSQDRVTGIGIAMPYELWKWGMHIGAPQKRMAAWEDFDLRSTLEQTTGLNTYLENDATAACGAELLLGRGQELENFFYLYLGFFIGGGIVLNNHLVSGPTGNAGSFGPMPIADAGPDKVSLLDRASIFVLENMLLESPYDGDVLWQQPSDWGDLGESLENWIADVAASLATAILATCAVIDFEAVVIDGGCPDNVRQSIVEATIARLAEMDLTGIQSPKVLEGSIGPNAPSLGGAILPIVQRYLLNA